MIAILQAKPEDLPGDQVAFKISLFVAVATNVVASLVLSSGNNLIIQASLDLLLAGSLLFLALRQAKLPQRFLQTFSAYCGVTAVFNGVYIIAAVVLPARDPAADPDLITLFLEYLFLVWSVAALAHILKHALNLTTGVSVLGAVSYFFTYVVIIQFFIGG